MNTVIELYTALQYDVNKVEAPSVLLDEFIHFSNKAVNQYVNKKYNVADAKQQYTDDLQELYSTLIIHRNGKLMNEKKEIIGSTKVYSTELGVAFQLPCDYLHILGAVVKYADCSFTAKRTTADIHNGVQANAYLKPDKKRPYFYLMNDTLEIRNNYTDFEYIRIDYIAVPQRIILTEEQLASYYETGIDGSDKLQFREYINYEILRELVSLVLEMTSDPRLQTNIPITQSIN